SQRTVVLEVGVGALEHLDVRPCAEELRLPAGRRPRDDDDVDVGIESRHQHVPVELAHHLVAVGVRGRRVQLQQRHSGFALRVDEGHGGPSTTTPNQRRSAPISFSMCSDCSIASAHSAGSVVTMAAAGSTMAAPSALAKRLTRFWKGWIRSYWSRLPLAIAR